MFWPNVKRRITAVAVQVGHATKPGISNVAKSSYYRSATLLMYTIVEGTVHQLVKKHTEPDNIVYKKIEHKQLYRIPKSVMNTPDEVYLCLKDTKNVHIDDNGVDFGKLNIYLKNKNIISIRQYRALERIRKERNKLHLQGLTADDTGYTNAKLKSASDCLDFLLPKL